MVRWILALMMTWIAVVPAQAEPPVARFDELIVEARDDWFIVRWSIDAAAWSWLNAEGRRPQMLLVADETQKRLAGRLAYTVSIDDRATRVLLPMPRSFNASEVTVWLQDGADASASARIAVGAVVADRLTLVVRQGPRAKPLDPFSQPVPARTLPEEVAAAPRAPAPTPEPQAKPPTKPPTKPATSPPRMVVKPVPNPEPPSCVTHDMAGLANVCWQSFVGTSAQQTCVAASQRSCLDPVPSIVACSEEATGSDLGARCVVAASRYALAPAPVVRACGEVLSSSNDVVACVERMAKAPWAAADTVRACGDSVTGGVVTLACLDAALDARLDPSTFVRGCAAERSGSAAIVDCVRTAVQAR